MWPKKVCRNRAQPSLPDFSGQTWMITGAAGFIGSNLVDTLLRRGARVIGLDNLDPYYPPWMKFQNIQSFRYNPQFHFYPVDVLDQVALESVARQYALDGIIHLAAKVGVRASWKDPRGYLETNIRGTLNLLELTAKLDIPRFILASSSSVYGNARIPFQERDSVQPISVYGTSKLAAEELCYNYHVSTGIKVIVLRLFTVYGPRSRPDLAIYSFLEKLLHFVPVPLFEGGRLQRDFTYIEDVVQAFCLAMGCSAKFAVFNIGSGKAIPVARVLDLLEKMTGIKARRIYKPRPPGDLPVTLASIHLAKRQLGYMPGVSFQEGLQKFYRWYLQFRVQPSHFLPPQLAHSG